MCKISIVVPVYNAAKYLDACITSILKQDFADYELILVDDGSKDNSLDICRSYEKRDCRVRAFSKSNGGVSSARNFGISVAEGAYITFIDADDYVDPNYCKSLMEHISNDVSAVVLGLQKAYPDGKVVPIKHRFSAGKYSFNEIVHKIVDDGTLSGFTLHSSCAMLFDLSIIKDKHIRFRENIRYNEDGLFNTEYVLLSKKNVYIDYDNTVYFYRTNLASATSTVDLLGETFKRSMGNVEAVLNGYTQEFEEIDLQMKRRAATIALSRLVYLASTDRLDLKWVKEILSDKAVTEGFLLLDASKMNKSKLLFCCAVRLKCYWTIYVILKRRYRTK